MKVYTEDLEKKEKLVFSNYRTTGGRKAARPPES